MVIAKEANSCPTVGDFSWVCLAKCQIREEAACGWQIRNLAQPGTLWWASTNDGHTGLFSFLRGVELGGLPNGAMINVSSAPWRSSSIHLSRPREELQEALAKCGINGSTVHLAEARRLVKGSGRRVGMTGKVHGFLMLSEKLVH